jgi:hypothetical protein
MLLERGRMVQIGDPRAIARAYNELNFGRLPQGAEGELQIEDLRAAEIRAAWFETGDGTRVTSVGRGEPVCLCVEAVFHADIAQPRFHFHLRNDLHQTIFATSTELHPLDTGVYGPGDTAIVRVRMDNWLAPGRYHLSPTLARLEGGAGEALDVRENLNTLTVQGTHHFDGVVDIPHTIDVERRP